jgi:pyruvate dehydrogenase E2 component (dihydrolipoamide acetyltransferase)
MAISVIMPALEMAQESGVLVSWLKKDGEAVTKGEPLMEIETDKVTVEIEAPSSGILGGILAQIGDVVPVGQTIAWILSPGETPPASAPADMPSGRASTNPANHGAKAGMSQAAPSKTFIESSPVARKIAEEHGVDLASLKSNGKRIEKADLMAYIQDREKSSGQNTGALSTSSAPPSKVPASPKARRLAEERGLNISNIPGSGPSGAVLTADVLGAKAVEPARVETVGTVWRRMAEHMTTSWTTVPHFYLIREVDASNLVEWRKRVAPMVEKRAGVRPTYTDLLIKLIGFGLREHPRLNAAWTDEGIKWNPQINVGFATAVEDGLIVPVIRNADASSISEIATQRKDLVERSQNRKLRPADISDGTFTISNLGMYKVDAFNAIVNTPQAAILAVGRIADRIVPVNGQAAVRPMMVISLSCDHRVVDGVRAAQYLDHLSALIEDPFGLLA